MGVIIALDESTVSTGYAVFKNNNLIECGAIVQKSKNVLERVHNIMKEIIIMPKHQVNNAATK